MRIGLLAVAVAAFTSMAGAAEDVPLPHKSLELLIGTTKPITKIQNNGKEDDIGSAGLSIGGRFISRVQKNIGIGAEIQALMPGEHTSTALIPNVTTTSKPSAIVFLGEVKFAGETGSVHPFFIVGAGLHVSNLTATGTLRPGFVWADTGTRETRQLIDSTRTAIAGTLQGGFDIPIQDGFGFGFSGGWYLLGKTSYSSPYGSVSGSMSALSILAKLTYAF